MNLTGKPPTCTAKTAGLLMYDTKKGRLIVCDGAAWRKLAAVRIGTEDNPAKSCKHILAQDPGAPSARYWLSPKPDLKLQLRCDMNTAGGGWIVVGHDKVDKNIHDNAAADPSDLVTSLQYEVDTKQLGALLAATKERRQFFEKTCRDSIMNKEHGKQHIAFSVPGGAKVKSSTVFFNGTQTACDTNDKTWATVKTSFVDTPNIPIMGLWGGDGELVGEVGIYRIGPLLLR